LKENNDIKKEVEQQQEEMKIEVDSSVAFQLKLQEFDRDIARLDAQSADLKRQKIEFIYNQNLQNITENHKSNLIKQQIEEEARKRLGKG
jgi:hypothetical protein